MEDYRSRFWKVCGVLMGVFMVANCQYPTATFYLNLFKAEIDRTTFANDIAGEDTVAEIGGVTFLLGGVHPQVSRPDWLEPTVTQLGWMFEGFHAACANGPGVVFGDTFGFHTWIYFSEITRDQTLWCKVWLEAAGSAELNSIRFCLALIGGQLTVIWNPNDVNTHLLNPNLGLEHNYQYLKLGVFAKYGWSYIAVNFKANTAKTKTRVNAYMANHDQCTTVGDTFELDGPMVDDVKFLFCLGATPWADQTDPYIPLYPLTALVNEVYFVAGEILERYHALDAFGYQCTDYCQICKKIDQPKCLEDFEPHVIHYWDFAPFRWVRPIHDYGSIPAPIVIPIPMDGSGIFAHHNGVWFQGRTLVAPPVTWDIFSFSVDVWLKHYDTRNGNLIETTDPAPRSWSFGFVSPNLFFTLNGNTQNYGVAFDAPRMYNKWFIAQASVARVGLLESKICVKWNDEPISCGFHDTIYDDNDPEAPITMMIGSGFSGYMRKIKIYDYPKQDPSFELMYKQEPQCYKFHHTQSDCEICDIDYNFTCYTECYERTTWDYDCKRCHDKCQTCSGDDQFYCMSCWRPRYIFHERCTCCPEECGDGFFMGDSQYDCDDGNNNDDDGCNRNCLFEAGFTCTNGSPLGPTVCNEICGDGRKINHACDDGNTNNGDGCSSTCAIEAGYQCTGGNRNTVDVCWEICGDGIDMANYPCDDGNTINGDGCSSVCTVELGWQCLGGSLTAPDTCTEICGDGWRVNQACDDKNTDNGDGCSSACVVENGWMCGHEQPSICWKISVPSVVAVTHEKGLISLTFNETIILDTAFNNTNDIGFELSGPFSPYNITYELLNATILKTPLPNMTVWFSYEISGQIVGNGSETLTLHFKEQSHIINSAYNFATINTSFTFKPFPQESNKTCGELLFALPIFFCMVVIIVIGVISALAGHSMAIAWQAITIIQYVNFIPLMMIYSPSCLVKFGKYFNVFNANFFLILTRLSQGKLKRDDFHKETEWKFIRAGYTTSSILYNAADLILIWLILLITIFVAYMLRRYCCKKNNRLKTQLDKIRNASIYVLMLFCYMRLTFLSMLNLRHIRFDDTLAIISSCLGIIGAITVFGYPLYEGWNVKQFSTELKTGLPPTQFRLHILYSDFKVSSPFQYAYFWQFFLRRFLFVGMIISWPQDKYLTLCLSTIMHMASMMYVAIVLPFTSRTKNIAVMISEGGLVAMHGYLFPIMRGDFSNELSFYHDKAFIFFLVVFLVIVVHLVLIIFDSIAHVKRVCRSCDKEPEDTPQKILDSFSSSSYTARDVSLDDDDDKNQGQIELYDPKKENEKIELKKKKKKKEEKAEERKKKKKRPPTPTKKGDPLVSEFGRPMFKDTQDIDPEKSSEEESSEESSSEDTEEAKIELPPFPGQSPLEGAGTLPVSVSKEGTPKPEEKKEASDVPKESTPAKEGTPAPPEDISRINFNPAPQAADPLTMTGASLVARDVHSLDQNPAPKEESKQ